MKLITSTTVVEFIIIISNLWVPYNTVHFVTSRATVNNQFHNNLIMKMQVYWKDRLKNNILINYWQLNYSRNFTNLFMIPSYCDFFHMEY